MSDSLRPRGLQQTRPPCPSPTPRVHSNPCPLSRWCHPTTSSSLSPSPPALSLPQHQGLFKRVSSSHQIAKVEFQLQHHSLQWRFRTDFLKDWLAGSPCSPGDSPESSLAPQSRSVHSSALSFLYSPAVTSVHDHWRNRSFEYANLCRQNNVSAF